jgi:hypothetical protein
MTQATLKARGVDTVGVIDSLTPQYTKSGSVYYKASFHYALDQQSQTVYTGNTKIYQNQRMQPGMTVPVVYDPQHPATADINFSDHIHTRDPYATLRLALYPLGGIMLVLGLLTPGIFIYNYRREKSLLSEGIVAIATLTGETEYNAGKAGRLAKISFQFTDSSGQIIDGVRDGLPTAENAVKYKRNQIMRDAILNNPLAVYDPRDSSKNMLYPGSYALCCAPDDPFFKSGRG